MDDSVASLDGFFENLIVHAVDLFVGIPLLGWEGTCGSEVNGDDGVSFGKSMLHHTRANETGSARDGNREGHRSCGTRGRGCAGKVQMEGDGAGGLVGESNMNREEWKRNLRRARLSLVFVNLYQVLCRDVRNFAS